MECTNNAVVNCTHARTSARTHARTHAQVQTLKTKKLRFIHFIVDVLSYCVFINVVTS